MKVIMLKTIEKVGNQGDVVNVKRGYARNYLVPRGFALYATPANLKNLNAIKNKLADEEQKLTEELKNLAEKIDSTKLVFMRKVDEHVLCSVPYPSWILSVAWKNRELIFRKMTWKWTNISKNWANFRCLFICGKILCARLIFLLSRNNNKAGRFLCPIYGLRLNK